MKQIKIILDTDLGSDCDDAGALAVLHRLTDCGHAEILAVTHCATEIGGAVTIKAINEWFSRAEIPIGRYEKESFLESERCKTYTEHIMKEYLANRKMPEFSNATRLMRKVLSEHDHVTLVCVGALNNYAELLKSEGDDISSLTGMELVEKSVDELYVQGANFQDYSRLEYNIKMDFSSAKYVAEHFPKPIIYCGYEIGRLVRTGRRLKETNVDNVIRKIYEMYSVYTKDGLRESWDPITVYCAIEKESVHFAKSGPLCIRFDPELGTMCSTPGKDHYLIMKSTSEEIEEVIDELMV